MNLRVDIFRWVKDRQFFIPYGKGVEPDYVIRTYDHLYDREALTNYINSLY